MKSKRVPTVLYVDDELWMMEGIVQAIGSKYHVITARNADQALTILEDSSRTIDLIVLDIMMPQGNRIRDHNRGRTSGLALAKHIREVIKCDTPIICYTVVNDERVEVELYQLGVNGILQKSESSQTLLSKISDCLQSG